MQASNTYRDKRLEVPVLEEVVQHPPGPVRSATGGLLAPGGDGHAPPGSGPEQQPRRDEPGSELRCTLATLPYF